MRETRYIAAAIAILLMALPASANRDRIEQTIRELSTHGSRLAGYPGDAFAADYMEQQLISAGVSHSQVRPPSVVSYTPARHPEPAYSWLAA